MSGGDSVEPDDANTVDPDGDGGSARRAFDLAHGVERLVDDPDVHEPILVVQLDGWIDAAEAAHGAADALDEACQASPIVRFDDDTYVDYRARRPTLELRDGISTNLVWATIELRAGRTPDGRDVLLLRGPEPDTAWHRFGRAIASLATELGVVQMIGFGAYPFAAPHTRRSLLSVSSPSTDSLASVPFLRSSVDVPAGAEAVLEHALHAAKIPTIGLWAQVPHYAAGNGYPAASMALLDGLGEVVGLRVDTAGLTGEAEATRARLDHKLADTPELAALLSNLEEMYDRAEAEQTAASGGDDPELEMRSGDELAAEIQRFLRDQD